MNKEITSLVNENKFEKRNTLPKIKNTTFMVRRTKNDMRGGNTEQLYFFVEGEFYKISAESAKHFANKIRKKRHMTVWDKSLRGSGMTKLTQEEKKQFLANTHLTGGLYAEMRNRTGLWNTVK
jgi:hypothetical protein